MVYHIILVTFLSFCVKCGHKLPEDASFCPNCGTPVASGVVAPEKLKAGDEIEEPTQRMSDSSKIEKLIEDLNNRNEMVRKAAVIELSGIGDYRAVEALIQALKHYYSTVRETAAEKLGEIGDSRAVEPLISVLRDAVDNVRRKAAKALGKMGDERAVEPLIEAMRERAPQHFWSNVEATRALGQIGGTRAVEALIKTMKNDKRYYIQSDEAQLLYGDRDSIWMATEAVQALEKIGEPSIKPLIQALQEKKARSHAAAALIGIGKPAIAPLIQASNDENEDIRKKIEEILKYIRNLN